MNRLNILYKERKNEIIGFYNKNKNIDIDNISDINDYIIDSELKKEDFDNPLDEFYIICAMCSYMISKNLYDDYFFESFDELLEEYNNGDYDDYFMDIDSDKALLSEDINDITNYILKDNEKQNYYNALSSVYENKLKDINEN